MKIMIIAPPNSLEDNKEEEFSYDNRITPLDLAYLGGILEESHNVKILDALALSLSKKQILDRVSNYDPDIVCLTAFDRCRWGIESANELIKHISGRKVGLIGSYEFEILLKVMKHNKYINFSIYGDPEYTLLELANENDFKDIKGLIYRDGDELIKNESRELIKDLDDLPFPARHLLPINAYRRMPHEKLKEPCIDMLVSRGCPYNCTYCSIKIIAGKLRRTRSPRKTIEEMKMLKNKYNVKQIHFQDPVLTINKKWILEFCDLLIGANLGLIWSCQTRTDCVDREILIKMKKAGCKSVLYGIESLDQKSLDNIKKGTKSEEIIKAIVLTKKIGIEARCSIMVGLPGETKNAVNKTVDLLIKANPAFAQFHSTVVFPGTDLENDVQKYGRVLNESSIKKLDLTGKPFVPKDYKDEEEVIQMQQKAYKRFYMRPKYIIKRVVNPNNFYRNLKGLKIFLNLLKK
ncbi:radical SAM protein [archaeon]|nr:radical SAM protein [archaeon]